jgi:hypothetical protein
MNKIIPISMIMILVLCGFGVTAISNRGMIIDKVGSDNLPPNKPWVDGPTIAKPGTYLYSFNATDPNGDNVSYFIDWTDNSTTGWIGPYHSGEEIKVKHTFRYLGTYTIRAKAKDIYNIEGDWGELWVRISQEKMMPNLLFLWFLERFPNAFPILRFLLEFNH